MFDTEDGETLTKITGKYVREAYFSPSLALKFIAKEKVVSWSRAAPRRAWQTFPTPAACFSFTPAPLKPHVSRCKPTPLELERRIPSKRTVQAAGPFTW